MPIHVDWYIPKRVIFIQLDGDITINDIHIMNHQLQDKLNVCEPLVHMLIDQSRIGRFPINIKEIRELLTVMRYEHFGQLIMYGKVNSLGEFVSGMVARMGGLKLRTFKTEETALEFLMHQDESLQAFTQQSTKHI